MAAKAGTDAASGGTLYRSLLMMFGISNAWLCAALAILLHQGEQDAVHRLSRREGTAQGYSPACLKTKG